MPSQVLEPLSYIANSSSESAISTADFGIGRLPLAARLVLLDLALGAVPDFRFRFLGKEELAFLGVVELP